MFVFAPVACRSRVDSGGGTPAPDSRGAFDLVVALQGIDGDAPAGWGKAEAICRGLKWPRCDRPALEEMQRRSRLTGVGKNAVSASAVAEVTWTFGSEDAVRKMVRTELDRIPEADGPDRARVFLRFAIVDTNFDGQAALFNQACVADASLCDREKMKAATAREVQGRRVSPGNAMPVFFAGHPKLTGPP